MKEKFYVMFENNHVQIGHKPLFRGDELDIQGGGIRAVEGNS